MLRILDETGAVVAELDDEGLIHGTAPRALAWLRDGVPSLRPKRTGKAIVEEPVVVKPDEPLYNLALAEACDNADWTLEVGPLAKSEAPRSQIAGTQAESRPPAAAAPPPAPPPVARPHHHQDAMQLPTKPTKRFPPPSHPKPTRAPEKLMSTPPEMTKAQRGSADDLLKAAGIATRASDTRHEADALLKAAGVDAKEPKPAPKPRAQKQVEKTSADVSKIHERMQKLHTKAADEAANRGDGASSKLHADAAAAHQAAAHAHGAGLDGADALSDKAKAATKATVPDAAAGKGDAKQTTSPQAAAQEKVASGEVTDKPNAGAVAAGVGGRSKEGLKVIAIGPKGGKIVGYTTKDGKQKPIYEGSKAAAKLAATVATHAPDPKPEPDAPTDPKGEDKAPEASPSPAPAADAAQDGGDKPEPDASVFSGDDDADPAAAPGAPPAPAAPAEPLDDKPLSPDAPPGGTPADAPEPEELGSASPKTDSPESSHAEQIAKLRGQVEEAHRKLEALAHHIDTNLVPMFNNLKGQARAAHKNPSPSVVGWLVAQIGRFAAFVLGLHEDKGKITAADAINGDASADEKKPEPKKPAKRPRMKSGKQASAYMQKSLTAPGAEGACVRVLVTLQAIERHHHAAHLQAQGPEAYQDHLLFGRLYEGLQDEIDGLSEKMVAAFGGACVDATDRAADAAAVLAEWSENDDPVDRALDAEMELQDVIEDALDEDVSPGLENFLQGIADTHEAAIYLLQQRSAPPATLARSITARQAGEAADLLKAAALEAAPEAEIPEWMGAAILGLHKGEGHRYIRRIPRAGGGYRYFYKVSGGKGLGHEDEMKVGSKFRMTSGGKDGHFEIVGKADNGDLRIKHDESGHESTVSPAALRSMLHAEHAAPLKAHQEKLRQDLADAKAAGASPKQIAKLEAEAAKAGVETTVATAPADIHRSTIESIANAPMGALFISRDGNVAWRKTGHGKTEWHPQKPSAQSPDGWGDRNEPASHRAFAAILAEHKSGGGLLQTPTTGVQVVNGQEQSEKPAVGPSSDIASLKPGDRVRPHTVGGEPYGDEWIVVGPTVHGKVQIRNPGKGLVMDIDPKNPTDIRKVGKAETPAQSKPVDINITHNLTPSEAKALDYRMKSYGFRPKFDEIADSALAGVTNGDVRSWVHRVVGDARNDPFSLKMDVPERPAGMKATAAKAIISQVEAVKDSVRSDMLSAGHTEAHDDYDTHKVHAKAYDQVAGNLNRTLGEGIGHKMLADTSGPGRKVVADAALHGNGALSGMAQEYRSDAMKAATRDSEVGYYDAPAYDGGPKRSDLMSEKAAADQADRARSLARSDKERLDVATAMEAKGFDAGSKHYATAVKNQEAAAAHFSAIAERLKSKRVDEAAKAERARQETVAREKAEQQAADEAHAKATAKPGEDVVHITLNDGSTTPVAGKVHHGEYAVHRPLKGGAGYDVTHLKTGGRIGHVTGAKNGADLVAKLRAAAPEFGTKNRDEMTDAELRAVQDAIRAHGATRKSLTDHQRHAADALLKAANALG